MEDSQIVDHLIQISSQVAALSAKLDATNDKLDLTNDSITKHIKDDLEMEKRVTALEATHNRWKWTSAGAMGVFVGLFKLIEIWWSSINSHH